MLIIQLCHGSRRMVMIDKDIEISSKKQILANIQLYFLFILQTVNLFYISRSITFCHLQ